MTIDSKAFRKKLIDDEKTMKALANENGMHIDRLRNILDERVNATESEVKKINDYSGVEG